MNLIDFIQNTRDRIHTWRRRRKIKKAYAKRAEAELGKSTGFTPMMKMWDLLQCDGYIEFDPETGEYEWTWP